MREHLKMKICSINGRGFASNTYILENNSEAFIFDPSAKENEIARVLDEMNAKPVGIILTHGHFDHTLSLAALREKYGVPVYIHTLDNEMLSDSEKNAGKLLLWREFENSPADKTFDNGDELILGCETVKILHTPGHTKGSCCFLAGDILITGDTLFAQGFGRYDLYGGDGEVLFKSLSSLKKLDGTLKIYPGHGEPSTLGVALSAIGIL
ncbi:MAG: MBL fold metallo-hydrolase [Clostridia bacterium]|nr:MBL fold metallo-hydrolase [Clostridia bacterium]